MKFPRIFVCFLLLCLISCAFAEELSLCPTAEWLPPDLSSLTESDPLPLRILQIAQQEVGYTEDENGSTKYVKWFGSYNPAWCTEFVSWCADQADQKWNTKCLGDIYPNVGTATEAAVLYIKANRFIGADGRNFDGEQQWLIGEDDYLADNGYIPQPGDVMWLYLYGGRDNPDHSTIVEGVSIDENGEILVHVIEGNIDPFVRRATYALSDPAIFGFGTTEMRAYTQLEKYSRYGGVNELRLDLASLGYRTGGSTYRLEGQLLTALKQFQKDHNLSVNGKVNIETRSALNAALEEVRK